MKKIEIISKSILALFFISLSFLVFSFLYSSIKKNSIKDLKKDKTAFEKSKNDSSILLNNMRDWENIEEEYINFKKELILRFEDFSNFRKELESLISMNYLSKAKFRIEYRRVLHNEYIKVKLIFSIEGSYENVKKFIYDIKQIKKIAYFKSVKLSVSGSNIRGSFNMEVYLVR